MIESKTIAGLYGFLDEKSGIVFSKNVTRKILYDRQKGKCYYCNCNLLLKGYYKNIFLATFDHIVPKSQGGRDMFSNIVLSCKRCNEVKKDTPYKDFKSQVITCLTI